MDHGAMRIEAAEAAPGLVHAYDPAAPGGRALLQARAGRLAGVQDLAAYGAEGLRCALLLDPADGTTVGAAGNAALETGVLAAAAALAAEDMPAATAEELVQDALEAEDVLQRAWRADVVQDRAGGRLLLLRAAARPVQEQPRGLLARLRRPAGPPPRPRALDEAPAAEDVEAVLRAAGWCWRVRAEATTARGRGGWRIVSWCPEELVGRRPEDDPRYEQVVAEAIAEAARMAAED